MADTPHIVVRASAGAGKTYALTSHYLRLMRHGATPQSILATTFTRKAAGEILHRVLHRLSEAAMHDEAAHRLGNDLRDPAMKRQDCRDMLLTVCRSLHRVCISTLDSFFNRTAQSFRLELGIPAQPRIVDRADPAATRLRAQTIEAMLTRGDPAVMLDLLKRLHHDTSQRSVTNAIDHIASSLEDVYVQAPDPELWRQYVIPPKMDDAALEASRARGEQIAATLPDKRLREAMLKSLQVARNDDWMTFINGGLGAIINKGMITYHKKPIAPDAIALIKDLIVHASAVVLTAEAQRTRATHELLAGFNGIHDDLRQTGRLLLFSELPRRLARAMADDTTFLMDMAYRMDQQVTHLMLDEFQDTSLEQWEVLRLLAEEITAHSDGSRSFYCVGDVKQAIYGWRGGCAEIFDHIESSLNLPPGARKQMNHSYRTSQIVLDAVNTVFGSLTGSPAFSTFPDVAEAWQGRFEDHSARADKPGFVELITSTKPPDSAATTSEKTPDENEQDNESDDATPTSHEQFVAEHIRQLTQDAPERSVGVLVARNSSVRLMIDLLSKLGVHASGEGGNPLTDDPAVNVVLAALTMADHPGDSAAAFAVLHSPLAEVVGLKSLDERHVAAIARHIRDMLATRGYAPLLADWTTKLAGTCDRRNLMRLTQLVDLADAYDPLATLRPTQFVDHVHATGVEEPAPAPVRVMTVHKAKGLEFDIVVLSELSRYMGKLGTDAVFIHRPEPTEPIDAVFRATRENVAKLCPRLREARQQSIARRVADDLCGLYVAMTRPRHALHMIIPPLKATLKGEISIRGWSNSTYATLLRRSLSTLGESESFEGNETLFEAGDPLWHESAGGAQPASVPAAAPTPFALNLAPPGNTSRRTLRMTSPSSLESAGRVKVADLLSLSPSRARKRGSVIHGWFELVEWIEDGQPDDGTLRQHALQNQQVEGDEVETMLADFKAMLARPGVVAALRRPTLAPGRTLDIWRERLFAAKVGDEISRGQFDRVVIQRKGDNILQATLIDFKTDRPTESGFDAAIEQYKPQMQAYRTALCVLLGVEPNAVGTSLLFVETGQRVDV